MNEITWYGYRGVAFEFEGKRATLIFPEQPNQNRDWTLKAEYREAFPNTEVALLKEGFHAAWLENETRWATKSDCDRKARFVDYLHETYGLRDKCVPVGMSCGGAHAVNFAGFYPDKVACLFIDAPVLNFLSNPGGYVHKGGDSKVWDTEFQKAYPGITRADLLHFDNHPIHNIPTIKAHHIPIILLYGEQDMSVDYADNGLMLEQAYEPDNPELKVICRRFQGHHPHGLADPKPIVDFVLASCGK